MIRIYRDVLDYLGIENMFIAGPENTMVSPLEVDISKRELQCLTDKEIYSCEGNLSIKVHDEYIVIPAKFEKEEPLLYRLTLTPIVTPSYLCLQERLQELERDHSLWDKRKEERFTIGLEGWEFFRLNQPEQTLFKNGKPYQCLINNVSFSGMNVTAFSFDSEFKIGMDVHIVLKFEDPIEQILIKAHILGVAVRSIKNGTSTSRKGFLSILSMQLVDTPLTYKKRIDSYIKLKK